VSSHQAAAVLSRENIIEAVRSLSAADWVRLKKVAFRYARPSISAEDLLQEAFARALDGRTCPAHIDVVRFLAEAMRSIAHGEQEKVAHRLMLVSAQSGDGTAEAMRLPDPAPSVEDWLIDAECAERVRTEILSLFDDDPAAKDIIEGIMEDLTAEEIRELTDLDKTAYDSKRKLIRRRINKHYPKGWKP
jgi:DNA-directed RNA polymerase specialized sigma24 family protein